MGWLRFSRQLRYGPVKANSCQMCHGVHGGENEAMLNLPGKDNCLACHAGIKTIMDNAVSLHDPVANGVCWGCHTPHASDYRPFLQGTSTACQTNHELAANPPVWPILQLFFDQ